MPFDGKWSLHEQKIAARTALIHELRENPPEWWDYSSASTCALAVGAELGIWEAGPASPSDRASTIGLSIFDFVSIFYGLRSGSELDGGVRPYQVAQALQEATYV